MEQRADPAAQQSSHAAEKRRNELERYTVQAERGKPPLHPADEHCNPARQHAVPPAPAKKDRKAGRRQHASRQMEPGLPGLCQNGTELLLELLHRRLFGADAAAQGIELFQLQQVVAGALAQAAGLGLGRQVRHGQRDHDTGCDDKDIDLLSPVCRRNAVEGVLHPKHFGPAVLQRFPHFDEDAEKLTDLCFAHKKHSSLWAGERPARYLSIIAQNGPKGKPCGKKCTAEQTLQKTLQKQLTIPSSPAIIISVVTDDNKHLGV